MFDFIYLSEWLVGWSSWLGRMMDQKICQNRFSKKKTTFSFYLSCQGQDDARMMPWCQDDGRMMPGWWATRRTQSHRPQDDPRMIKPFFWIQCLRRVHLTWEGNIPEGPPHMPEVTLVIPTCFHANSTIHATFFFSYSRLLWPGSTKYLQKCSGDDSKPGLSGLAGWQGWL